MTIDQINDIEQNQEPIEARAVTQSELDTIELSVREQLDEQKSSEQIRSSISNALEAIGQAPLAENETERTFTIEIDGESVERTIVIDPSDFGTAIRSIAEMGIDGFSDVKDSLETETPAARVERLLGEVALSSRINEGVVGLEDRLGVQPITSDRVQSVEAEENIESDVSEAESEPNNDELMAEARQALESLKTKTEVAGRASITVTDDITEILSRPMIHIESLENATRWLQRQVTEMVEQGSTITKKLSSVNDGLDSRSPESTREMSDIDDAFSVIRRSSASLDEELSSNIRIFTRLVQDAEQDPAARQQLVARGRHLADVVNESVKRHSRALEEIQL